MFDWRASLKAPNALTKYTFFDIKRIIFNFFYFFFSLYQGTGSSLSRPKQIAVYYPPPGNLLLHFLYYQ